MAPAILVVLLVLIGLPLAGRAAFQTAHLPYDTAQVAASLLGICFDGLLVGLAWRLGPGRSGDGWQMLGFRKAPALILILVGPVFCIWGFSLLMAYFLALNAAGLSELARAPQRIELAYNPLGAALLFLEVCVAAPIGEETFTRGFLLGGLRSRLPLVVSLLLSAAVFAGLHLEPKMLVVTFILGIGLGASFLFAGSLFPSMLAHGLWNFSLLLLNYATRT